MVIRWAGLKKEEPEPAKEIQAPAPPPDPKPDPTPPEIETKTTVVRTPSAIFVGPKSSALEKLFAEVNEFTANRRTVEVEIDKTAFERLKEIADKRSCSADSVLKVAVQEWIEKN